MPENKAYTKDSIFTYGDMEYIRLRPNNLLPSLDTRGLVHMLWEYISNSMDEIVQKDGGTILVVLLRNPATQDFQIVVRDDGRGLPTERVQDAYTKLKTSGKIDKNSAYNSSAGQFGMGAKAGAALSSHFRVISKHYLGKESSSLMLEDGAIKDFHTEEASIPDGVTVLLQPDLKIFNQAMDFASTGYLDMLALCKQLNIFNDNVNFNIFVIDRLFPKRIWEDDINTVVDTIRKYINAPSAHREYCSEDVSDKSEYLFELWRSNSSIIFRDSFDKRPVDSNDKLGFGVRFFLSKKSATGNTQYFVSLNNVVLKDKADNSASLTFLKTFREIVASRVEDEKLKKFTIEEYTFPTLYLALGVLYNGALLGGTTKSTFHDAAFDKQFYRELSAYFAGKDDEYWVALMAAILPDIAARYSAYYDTAPKKQDTQKTFLDLNFPRNFAECRSFDNTKTELFLVEGTSAGNIISTRNNDYQAIYQTRGKPYNAATRPEQMEENRRRLMRDPIYQDIVKILHIDPNTTNLNQSRYSKIIIATDADDDGYHIRSLHINNLYIINPLIVTSGMVWLANPPLYSMQLTNNRYLFLRDKNALMDAKVRFLYEPSLEFMIHVNTPAGDKTVVPDDKLYRETCYILEELGEAFTLAAKQLNIPLLILERLCYAVKALFPVINFQELEKYFVSSDMSRFVTLDYNPEGHYLVVSVGHNDYAVGLKELGDTIVTQLLPLMKKYKYDKLFFMIRGKNKHTGMVNPIPASPMQVFTCLSELDSIVKVHRYKGLGEMPTDSCLETIMDPTTRSLTQVTDVGSFVDNYALLGKDSTTRKNLLSESGALAASMVQQHKLSGR